MSTKIEWSDETWNVVTGCDKVSPGCDNCYIVRSPPFRMEGRKFDERGKMGIRLHGDRMDKPLHWKKPRKIFVNSLSDLFHPDIPDGFIGSVWNVMALTPQHTYQILTKRPQRMAKLLKAWAEDHWQWRREDMRWCGPMRNPLPNVWLGVSVENQTYADLRIPYLLETPAAVRFLSMEPLLEDVNLSQGYVDYLGGWKTESEHSGECTGENCDLVCPVAVQVQTPKVDWVIVGGESGPKAREMHPAWAQSVRDQCLNAGTPFFFKHWGEWVYPDQMPEDCPGSGGFDAQSHRAGKKAAGRLLDGVEWNQFPG